MDLFLWNMKPNADFVFDRCLCLCMILSFDWHLKGNVFGYAGSQNILIDQSVVALSEILSLNHASMNKSVRWNRGINKLNVNYKEARFVD